MTIRDYVVAQLRKPTGFFGRQVVARFLSRANTTINQRTLEALSIGPEDRVLEVGPGPGDLMDRIARLATRGSVTGVDFSQDMVEACSKRFAPLIESGRVEIRCATADAIPFPSGRFSKACAVNTIYFWPEPVIELTEIRRVLRPGGRFVVSFIPRVTTERFGVNPAFRAYSGEEVMDLLGRAGFRDIRIIEGRDRRGEFRCVVGSSP